MYYFVNGLRLTQTGYKEVMKNQDLYEVENAYFGKSLEKGFVLNEGNLGRSEKLADKLSVNGYGHTIIAVVAKTVAKEDEENVDMINHPPHYNAGDIEVIDYIKDVLTNATHLNAWEGYLLGNSLKYKSHRLGRKTNVEDDLKKSMFYDEELLKYQEEK